MAFNCNVIGSRDITCLEPGNLFLHVSEMGVQVACGVRDQVLVVFKDVGGNCSNASVKRTSKSKISSQIILDFRGGSQIGIRQSNINSRLIRGQHGPEIVYIALKVFLGDPIACARS